jgi:hypothetical protein
MVMVRVRVGVTVYQRGRRFVRPGPGHGEHADDRHEHKGHEDQQLHLMPSTCVRT